MNEDRATRYQRHRRQAAVVSAVVGGAGLAGLVLSGGSALLRDAAMMVAGESETGAAVIFTLVVAVLAELLLLPLAHFEGVTLEQRYGLTAQSPADWWRDHAKASVLQCVGVLVAGLVTWLLLQRVPGWWWVAAAAAFTLGQVLLTQVAPVVLLPLFDRCEPLRREALVDRLLTLARRAETRVLGVFEWRMAWRTKKANAALAGLGRTRRILVSDTLLAGHSDDEIEVILAHELAHHVYHDIWVSLAVRAALVTVAAYAADLILSVSMGTGGVNGKGDVAALPLVALAWGGASVVLMPILNAVSRAQERRADRYALEMTRNVPAFVSAMKRLGAQNLSDDRPSPMVEFAFYTHPPVTSRIQAAQAWAAGRR